MMPQKWPHFGPGTEAQHGAAHGLLGQLIDQSVLRRFESPGPPQGSWKLSGYKGKEWFW